MLVNQASSTPPTTAASLDQVMPDGAGRLSTSIGPSRGLQMAWRLLPAFRSDICSSCKRKEKNHESDQKLEVDWRLGAARLDCRHDDPAWFGEGPRILSAGGGGETGPEPADPGHWCRRIGERHFAAHSAHLIARTT